MIEMLNIGLVMLMLGLSAWIISARETFSAVLAFIMYGLLLTLVWLQLSGIDVALTEAAIGGGLTGALLIGAATRLRGTENSASSGQAGTALKWQAGIVSCLITGMLAVSVLTLPDPAPSLAAKVAENIEQTGVANPITAVLLAFRAMDTLLEAVVLVFALIGVWSLTPDRFWPGRPGLKQSADPDGILAFAARILTPVGMVVGLYIFWVGADHPGGKFQGATILAAMWLLVMMAGLADAPAISRRLLRMALVLGPLVFIGIGILGVYGAGAFLAYPAGFAKPLILTVEFALMPSLTLILGLLLLGAPQRGEDAP
jgi:multisubunit Na+/H+ antiporter MnhB subunit